MTRRTIYILVLATVLLGGFFMPAHTYALSISGGEIEQRQWVEEAVWSAAWPDPHAIDDYYGGIEVRILPENPPYWYIVGTSMPGKIDLSQPYYDSRGLHAQGEVTTHEWAHQVWFTLGSEARGEWNDWYYTHSEPDPQVWTKNPIESFAEQLRVAAWPSRFYNRTEPRTDLPVRDVDELKEFVMAHAPTTVTSTTTSTTTVAPTTTTTTTSGAPPVSTTTTTTAPPPTTTTTVQRGNPFSDIERSEDEELWQASWYAKDEGFVEGYEDGTLGPYEPLLRRHVALIAMRADIISPPWRTDYTEATRGEVRDVFEDFTWKEERWPEPLLRSQLIRLLWRAQ